MAPGGEQLRFDGRVAIVTGAGRGLGRAHALLLAERGAAVVVNDLGGDVRGQGSSSAPAERVVEEIRAAGGEAIASTASVAEERGAREIVATALRGFGRLDVLVNNAGNIVMKPFAETGPEDFRAQLEVHVLGTASMCREALPAMLEADYGRIVNTTSNAFLGIRRLTGYGAAKAGVLALTMSLAVEHRKTGVRINAVAPAAESRMLHENLEGFGERVAAQVRQMPPELVSPMVAYLAHESCQRNGEAYYAGGGEVFRFVQERTAGLRSEQLSPELIAAEIEAIADPGTAEPL